MPVELTDVLINQVLFLHSKKFKPKQINVVTDVPVSKIERIVNSRLAKKKKPSAKFDWKDFGNSII